MTKIILISYKNNFKYCVFSSEEFCLERCYFRNYFRLKTQTFGFIDEQRKTFRHVHLKMKFGKKMYIRVWGGRENIPGQESMLQTGVSEEEPVQLRPPCAGLGLLQDLDRVFSPLPEVAVHVDQLLHEPHPPFTANKWYVGTYWSLLFSFVNGILVLCCIIG